jgi:hypothetical protein
MAFSRKVVETRLPLIRLPHLLPVNGEKADAATVWCLLPACGEKVPAGG